MMFMKYQNPLKHNRRKFLYKAGEKTALIVNI